MKYTYAGINWRGAYPFLGATPPGPQLATVWHSAPSMQGGNSPDPVDGQTLQAWLSGRADGGGNLLNTEGWTLTDAGGEVNAGFRYNASNGRWRVAGDGVDRDHTYDLETSNAATVTTVILSGAQQAGNGGSFFNFDIGAAADRFIRLQYFEQDASPIRQVNFQAWHPTYFPSVTTLLQASFNNFVEEEWTIVLDPTGNLSLNRGMVNVYSQSGLTGWGGTIHRLRNFADTAGRMGNSLAQGWRNWRIAIWK